MSVDNENSTTVGVGRRLARLLLPLLVLAVAAFAAMSMMDSAPQAARRPPPERQARLVEVVEAERGTQAVTVAAWGEARPARELALSSEVSGRVTRIHADLAPGGYLEAGAVALVVDPSDYELQLQRARSELTRAEAALAQEQGQQAVARREFELLGGSSTEQERSLILRQPQLATAEAAVAAARADVEAAELAVARAQLRVPFDALVLDRTVVEGSQISTGGALATLAGTEEWWVEVAVPVSALPWIDAPRGRDAEGAVVRLYDTAWPAGQYREGRVVRLLGALEEEGRMARLLVEVQDPLALRPENADKPALLIGSFMQARIEGRPLDDAVAIDPAWLREGDRVWLMDAEGRLEMRTVEVAYRGADRVLIRGGLDAGERIVTTPINAAAEGMPLRISKPAAAVTDAVAAPGAGA